MLGNYTNEWTPDDYDPRIWSVCTEPKFAIGQRCILLETPEGNVLWDCITYLDNETIKAIKARGGLKAIVISHPHYYTTHLDWAEVFDCPVYISAEDKEWVNRANRTAHDDRRQLINGQTETMLEGVTAIKVGGHFPGSLVLHWDKKLFIADSMFTVPSGLNHVDRLPGTTSYAFMWSIPNMIPLPPSDLHKMWQALKPFDFTSTHGMFVGQEIRDDENVPTRCPPVKARILDSMQIQTRTGGWKDAEILKEYWPGIQLP